MRNIYWKPVEPSKKIETDAPEKYINMLIQAFGNTDAELNESHLEKLQGMAIFEPIFCQALITGIRHHGKIKIFIKND